MYIALKYLAIMTTDSFLQQTIANTQQIRDVEGRVRSLARFLTSPVGDQNSEEKARREALRRFVLQHSEIPSHC